jgi:hypothetical protein
MPVPVFGFVRAHPPVLNGGAAAGQGSRVLSMSFVNRSVLSWQFATRGSKSLSVWLADCLYILESVERCVRSAGGQKYWPQESM